MGRRAAGNIRDRMVSGLRLGRVRCDACLANVTELTQGRVEQACKELVRSGHVARGRAHCPDCGAMKVVTCATLALGPSEERKASKQLAALASDLRRLVSALRRHPDPAIRDAAKGYPRPWKPKRGPAPFGPRSGSIQIALLGQYLALQDRFHRLHRKYRQKAEGWEKGWHVDHITVENTLLDLKEEFGFTSLAAVKRAAVSGQVARAALQEMNTLYPIRSRPGVDDPSNSFGPAFKRAREIIRSTRLDPFTVSCAEAFVPAPREEELPKEDVERITNRVARDVALKRLAERGVEQATQRIALDAYRELKSVLDTYVKTRRAGVR